jgi:hypothetical protein
MFTALTFGLCALIIEGHASDPITRPDIGYPAVGIGIVAGNRCRLQLVLAANSGTPGIPINGGYHQFKVGKVDSSSAVISGSTRNHSPFRGRRSKSSATRKTVIRIRGHGAV